MFYKVRACIMHLDNKEKYCKENGNLSETVQKPFVP